MNAADLNHYIFVSLYRGTPISSEYMPVSKIDAIDYIDEAFEGAKAIAILHVCDGKVYDVTESIIEDFIDSLETDEQCDDAEKFLPDRFASKIESQRETISDGEASSRNWDRHERSLSRNFS